MYFIVQVKHHHTARLHYRLTSIHWHRNSSTDIGHPYGSDKALSMWLSGKTHTVHDEHEQLPAGSGFKPQVHQIICVTIISTHASGLARSFIRCTL